MASLSGHERHSVAVNFFCLSTVVTDDRNGHAMLQSSFSAAHVQLLREVRKFRTGACGRPERKHSQIFDNIQHFSAFKLLFANIVTVRRSSLHHVLVHVGISVNILLLTFMLF